MFHGEQWRERHKKIFELLIYIQLRLKSGITWKCGGAEWVSRPAVHAGERYIR